MSMTEEILNREHELKARIQNFEKSRLEATEYLSGRSNSAPSGWGDKYPGSVGIAAAFVYSHVTANFSLNENKRLKFTGDGGGIGIAGGEFWGDIILCGTLEDLTKSSCLFTVEYTALVGGVLNITWSRDFVPLANFTATGIGIYAGGFVGSGQFELA